uniref:Uncharacterized protein n=1 Tax=viral metagenome TaxID=1070528 RepID=A0A6M3JW80_9ZZZZ
MIIEYIYPFALAWCFISGLIIMVVLWWLYDDVWHRFVGWLADKTDRLFYGFLDMILGKHEDL